MTREDLDQVVQQVTAVFGPGAVAVASDSYGARDGVRQCPECWALALLQSDGWYRCERCALTFRECLNGVA